MTDAPQLRTSEEIRRYLVGQLNLVLRRPEMYGGEPALWMLFDHLLHAEAQDSAVWEQHKRDWERRGAWSATGVAGAIRQLLPEPAGPAVASIFTEAAHQHGWLSVDRAMPIGEYRDLRAGHRDWARRDRVYGDILEAFGPPSILLGGTNPYYGKTLGYLAPNSPEPIIWFHLWNGTDPGSEPGWPPSHEQPLLLATREGDGPLPKAIAYTPDGERRRPRRS